MSGTLFVVATPIGNLEDMSPRARQTLAAVDLIAAEDTRHTGRLLSHFGLKKPLIALHDHNEEVLARELVAKLLAGRSIALVSDAGTPLLSDPGYRLVNSAHAEGVRVSPVPGPAALVAAISAAGLPTDRFCFEGFLPSKKKARAEVLASLKTEPRTMILYESVHRIPASLDDLCHAFGADRQAFLGRELTKLHEQCVAGTLGELRRRIAEGSVVGKGEFVLVVGGAPAAAESPIDSDHLLTELAQVLPGKDAARIASRVTGEKRNVLYRRLLELTR